VLQDDCCACSARPVGTAPAACDAVCTGPRCTDTGSDVRAVCERGFCVLDVDCERRTVTCDHVEPTCPPGMIATAVDGCYGPCVDARECPSVPGCDVCAEGDLCVRNNRLGSTTHCVEVPSACATTPDCACLGDAVCFYVCADAAPLELTCFCPGC
jgi:hypothetical protein